MIRKGITALIILTGAVWALLTIHPATPATPISGTMTHVSASVDVAPMPACTYEDGSGQALCMWDASEQGNGMGTDVIAGDCSIGTVGSIEASNECLTLWAMGERTTYLADGAVSVTSKGSVLVDECLTIEWEASNDKAIRESLINDGWNLTECFKAMQ
jgi:hypothetical protein